MLSKSTIKSIRALHHHKYRQKYHKIILEGSKSVAEVISLYPAFIESVYATPLWLESNRDLPGMRDLPVTLVADHELAKVSALTTPPPVIAICGIPDQTADPEKMKTELCLYLDGIRDPGNLGTIFRVADWFGFRHIFLSGDCVDPYNPKVIQSSMGSLFRIQWRTMNLHDVLEIPGIRVFAATLDGEDVFMHTLTGQGVLILGNESEGIRNLPDSPQITRLSIPGQFRLGAESLNVAVAAGILCAEFRRR